MGVSGIRATQKNLHGIVMIKILVSKDYDVVLQSLS